MISKCRKQTKDRKEAVFSQRALKRLWIPDLPRLHITEAVYQFYMKSIWAHDGISHLINTLKSAQNASLIFSLLAWMNHKLPDAISPQKFPITIRFFFFRGEGMVSKWTGKGSMQEEMMLNVGISFCFVVKMSLKGPAAYWLYRVDVSVINLLSLLAIYGALISVFIFRLGFSIFRRTLFSYFHFIYLFIH